MADKDSKQPMDESCTEKVADMYCPQCGAQGPMRTPGEGDYYLGPMYQCPTCRDRWHLG